MAIQTQAVQWQSHIMCTIAQHQTQCHGRVLERGWAAPMSQARETAVQLEAAREQEQHTADSARERWSRRKGGGQGNECLHQQYSRNTNGGKGGGFPGARFVDFFAATQKTEQYYCAHSLSTPRAHRQSEP